MFSFIGKFQSSDSLALKIYFKTMVHSFQPSFPRKKRRTKLLFQLQTLQSSLSDSKTLMQVTIGAVANGNSDKAARMVHSVAANGGTL